MRMSGVVPPILLTVPVLPVPDLPAVVAGLRAIGFTVDETTPRNATATWPGTVLELVHAPSTRGIGCHLVVESIDVLVATWKAAGIDPRIVDNGQERIVFLELPGGLSLSFGVHLPPGYQQSTRRRKPGRRASRAH